MQDPEPRTPAPPIRKRIVTDEALGPVAVQVDWADWLRIEPILRERGLVEASETGEQPGAGLAALAAAARPYWRGGDGLAYQLKIRSEWEDRP